MERLKIRRALVSVSDKSGLALLKPLADIGCQFVSSDGTRKQMLSLGFECQSVECVTGFPEILGGRVKTLHPKVHAGILANRSEASHMTDIERFGLLPFDMVVSNLYQFNKDPSVEKIDIGGPSMIRGAAKNYKHVVPLMFVEDYERVVSEIRKTGTVSEPNRKALAVKVFKFTSEYDGKIAGWLEAQ